MLLLFVYGARKIKLNRYFVHGINLMSEFNLTKSGALSRIDTPQTLRDKHLNYIALVLSNGRFSVLYMYFYFQSLHARNRVENLQRIHFQEVKGQC